MVIPGLILRTNGLYPETWIIKPGETMVQRHDLKIIEEEFSLVCKHNNTHRSESLSLSYEDTTLGHLEVRIKQRLQFECHKICFSCSGEQGIHAVWCEKRKCEFEDTCSNLGRYGGFLLIPSRNTHPSLHRWVRVCKKHASNLCDVDGDKLYQTF